MFKAQLRPDHSVRLGPADLLEVDALADHLPERAELAQAVDGLLEGLEELVDLLVGGEPADADAEGGVGEVLGDSERAQDVGGLEGLAGAGRSGAHCVLLHGHEETLALDEREGHVDVAEVALPLVAVQLHVAHARADAVQDLAVEPLHVPRVVLHLALRHLAGLAESHHQWRRQRPRPEPALLPAAVDERGQPDAWLAAQVERADALGPVDLVPADAHQVDVHLVDIDLDLARGLRRVGVQEHLVLPAELPDLLDVLPYADLVVDQDDAHAEHLLRRVLDGPAEEGDVEDAVLLDGQVGDPEALELEVAAGVEDALVLDLRGDDVPALLAVELGQPLEHHVVGLGGARSEDDLLGVRADQRRHLSACLLDGRRGVPPELVRLRVRVAVEVGQEGHHRVQHAVVDGRGRLVVEVLHLPLREGEGPPRRPPQQRGRPPQQARQLPHTNHEEQI